MKPAKFVFLSLIFAFSLVAMDGDWCGTNPGLELPKLEEEEELDAVSFASEGIKYTAFDIFKELKKTEKNIIFSPFSIHASLAMTYAGARGNTESAMKEVLTYGDNSPAFHRHYAKLMTTLMSNGNSEEATLKISNDIWIESRLHIEPSFIALVAQGYNAQPIKINFADTPEDAMAAINKKVSIDTNGEIPNLLSHLDSSTAMVLTNAVFLEAPWATQFAEITNPGEFIAAEGGVMAANYMTVEDRFGYGEDSNKQFLFMPYKGTNLTALIVLPKEGMLENYMAEMEAFDFSIMMESMYDRRNVNVMMPTFGIRSAPRLKDVLTALGLGTLFESETCNLSGMNGVRRGEGKLTLSDVVHQAMIEMTPLGTKAAAATATMVMRSTSVMEPETPVLFHATRPFDFYIVDTKTQAIMFMGRLMEPSQL